MFEEWVAKALPVIERFDSHYPGIIPFILGLLVWPIQRYLLDRILRKEKAAMISETISLIELQLKLRGLPLPPEKPSVNGSAKHDPSSVQYHSEG